LAALELRHPLQVRLSHTLVVEAAAAEEVLLRAAAAEAAAAEAVLARALMEPQT